MSVERTALKEWAVLADALGRGEVLVLLRKGGIREQRAGFSVRHERFLIYPTWFHEKERELAARFRERLPASHADRPAEGTVRLSLVADVAEVWRVTELDRLRDIDWAHGLDWSAVESRFHYRDRPLLHVVAVRVARLARQVELPEARRYQGCVSWVELDTDVDVSGAAPVISDEQFDAQLARLGDTLTPGSESSATRKAIDRQSGMQDGPV